MFGIIHQSNLSFGAVVKFFSMGFCVCVVTGFMIQGLLVHGWAKKKPIDLILRQYAYLKVMFLYFFISKEREDQKRKRPQHTTQTHNKHHHHSGGAACPSSGMDLMNPHCPRGGRPCAFIVQGCCQKDFNSFTKLM
jgi:hypothetical protein